MHLPPELDRLPERNVRHDATINLHAFIFNLFGSIDNRAWIWVSEKAVTDAKGRPISPRAIGFGEKCIAVRASFSRAFQEYLVTRKSWFDHLENYRHALTHRIPLYIPPHIVPPENVEAYARLEQQRVAPGLDAPEYARLSAAQDALVSFEPIMTLAFGKNAPTVPFHIQMLQDFNTIDELGRKILDELRR